MHAVRTNNRAFSLIELVIVVVILGIIGAIAIPRMSRGAAGAADSAVMADVATLRNAIEMYRAEHNGAYPTSDATLTNQLTQFTDLAGDAQATKDATHIYGPYLHAIPRQKVGAQAGKNGVSAVDGTATAGWIYLAASGKIYANCAVGVSDQNGIDYRDY